MDKNDPLWLEEEFHREGSRKIDRKERRALILKDRSKFKKTDQDKRKKEHLIDSSEHTGRVLTITPEGIVVSFEGKEYLSTLKGALKKEIEQVKNPVVVGDIVRFSLLGSDQGVISSIQPRYSILSRADNLSRNKEQLIAANIDIALIFTSVCTPALKPPLLDRYIIAAKKGNILPVIVVNKMDLLSDETIKESLKESECSILEELKKVYASIGIPIFCVSAHTQEGLESLKEFLEEKTAVLSGQSGVGKTSLINALYGTTLKIGEITQKTKKGAHTTTASRLYTTSKGGFCIDTPGIKSFGLWDLDSRDIQSYFSEIAEAAKLCRFANCSHLTEPDCHVRDLVEKEMISPLRFASYSGLMTGSKEVHRKR